LYFALKLLHLLAVMLFLGNIITGLFWKLHGDRTGDPRIMAHTLDGIMMGRLPILGTGWILHSIILFSVSGLAFGFQVAPLQRRLLSLTSQAAAGGAFDAALYRKLSWRWEIGGLVAVLTPLAAFALMVFKPGAP